MLGMKGTMNTIELATAFEFADAIAQAARNVANDLWRQANAAETGTAGDRIVQAERVDVEADRLASLAEAAAEAFMKVA